MLGCTNFKDDLSCNKIYQRKFNETLEKRFFNTCEFSKHDNNKFIYEGEYHDFYAQSDTLLLADVFQNFKIMCLEIYEVGLAKFLSAAGLAWQATLKKIKVKSDLLTDIDMLLMKEKCIRAGIRFITVYKICNAIYWYAKDNNV